MIKIMFISGNLCGGGAQRVLINLLKALDRDKFIPVLFLFFREGVFLNDIPKDVLVYSVFEKRKNLLFNIHIVLLKLIKVAREMNIVVGAVELFPTYVAIIVGKLYNLKTIGWVHTDIQSFFDRTTVNGMSTTKKYIHKFLTKFFYPMLDGIITVSNGAQKSILSLLPQHIEKKTKTIYNPNSLDAIVERAQENVILNYDCPIIMAIGRLSPQKNFALLIKAHAKLIKDGIKNQLLILGEGQERSNLENLIADLDLKNSVTLIGFKSNPYSFLKNADVFVLSSIYEGLPTVIIEALALGVPIVSTDCPGGAKEILDNGKFGVLVKINDLDEMADAIKKILTDAGLSDRLKQSGIKRATLFDAKTILPEFEDFFTKQ